jgi:hypothetical protein
MNIYKMILLILASVALVSCNKSTSSSATIGTVPQPYDALPLVLGEQVSYVQVQQNQQKNTKNKSDARPHEAARAPEGLAARR